MPPAANDPFARARLGGCLGHHAHDVIPRPGIRQSEVARSVANAREVRMRFDETWCGERTVQVDHPRIRSDVALHLRRRAKRRDGVAGGRQRLRAWVGVINGHDRAVRQDQVGGSCLGLQRRDRGERCHGGTMDHVPCRRTRDGTQHDESTDGEQGEAAMRDEVGHRWRQLIATGRRTPR